MIGLDGLDIWLNSRNFYKSKAVRQTGSAEHMAPDANVLINYKPAAPGDMVVEVAQETLVPV